MVFRAGRRGAFRVFVSVIVFLAGAFALERARLAGLVADTAVRLAAVAALVTARFADFTTFFVSSGANRRAMPAAATAPMTTLVIPIVASEWFDELEGLNAPTQISFR
jgi:hypothetical protein